MSVRTTSIAAILALAIAPGAAAQSEEERGRSIAEEADRRTRGYGDMQARLTMTLQNRHGEERVRELTVQVLEAGSSGERTLLVFERPLDLRGTALLTHASPDGSDARWLYLPALRRVKRVASSEQSSAFLGTEFSYEDIGPEDPDEYTYRLVEPSLLAGVECWTVERFPRDPGSGYGRQIVWFDREAYRVRRVDYYDRAGELLKTLIQDGFRLYADRFWRPDRMEMRNHRSGALTRVEWTEVRVGVGLSEADFDRSRLGRM